MELMPLKLQPCYKEYLWGGERLKKEYGKTDAPDVTAESWELASNAAGSSLPLLTELERRAFWGTSCRSEEFPILVKLIDAAKPLSIQVHPSDETAVYELGERGKAEMWYIMDCKPQAFIYYGFSRKLDRKEFLRRAGDGSICEVLNKVPVSKGDVFCIQPGTIHAVGAGMVIAEIQQNSDTTFRIYDYGRVGKDGKPRALHLERAAEAVCCEPVVPAECKINSSVVFPEFQMTELFSCDYFRAWKIDLTSAATFLCDGTSFHHLLCVEGAGEISAKGRLFPYRRGDSYFIPAAMGEYTLRGESRLLLAHV